MYLEPAVATGFCSSPLHCRPDPAAACWWMLKQRYWESWLVHSTSARTSTSPFPSTVSQVSAMRQVARALTRAHGSNHSAQNLRLLRRLPPTLLQWHRRRLPVFRFPARSSGRSTLYPCIPRRFICAASGYRTIFTRRPCFSSLDCVLPITDKPPMLTLPSTALS